ncbi:MAG: glycogen debranching enzyme N-terminal domain-containing protein, partial [Kiritimatiellia bacterium]
MALVRGSTVCRDPALALQSEWVETNACGGYAASTLLNAHTRKYHGLLVAALRDPPGRFVLLSKLDDVLIAGNRELPLSLHLYARSRMPSNGDFCLHSYTQDDSPVWHYRAGDIELEKRILLLHNRNTVLIGYRLLTAASIPLRLRLRPLLAYRGIHDLQRETSYLNAGLDRAHGGFRIQPFHGMPTLYVRTSGAADIYPDPLWYRHFDYARERERGFQCQEDLFTPATITVALPPDAWLIVAAGLDGDNDSIVAAWDAELARRHTQAALTRTAAVAAVGVASPHAERLTNLMTAGHRFFFHAPDGRASLIAGFPWFDDWSRDTLIALPGLMLASGRTDDALDILKAIAAHERNGLLPNFFAADPAQHAYNSADASLWFFRAIQHAIDAGLTIDTLRTELWPVMRRIIKAYRQGADAAVHTDETGMLFAGSPDTQLTWM